MAEKFPAIESGYQDLNDATSLPNFRLDNSGEVTFSHLGRSEEHTSELQSQY